MTPELSTTALEQYEDPNVVERFTAMATHLQRKLGRMAAAGLVVVAGTFSALTVEEFAHPETAHADTLDYPDYAMPCEHAPYNVGGTCANYDWGPVHTESYNDPSEFSRRGYAYRNCTDYVAWKESTIGVTVPHTLGNGGQWYNNVPASEKSKVPKAWDAAVAPGNPGHLAFVESVNSIDPSDPLNDNITVSEYNHDAQGRGDTRSGKASSMGFTEFVDFGVHPSGAPTSGGDLHGFIQVDAAINAKASRGFGSWTQEASPGNAAQFAIGGTYQMFLRGDGAAFAKNTLGAGSWTQETNPGGASAIAVSSTGLLMIIGTDNAVYSQRGISPHNWLQEVGPGNASKIAVGGENMMFLRGDGAEFAKTGQGGVWTQETNAGGASAIAVSSTGIHLIIGTDNAVYSKPGNGFGGWTQEVGPGNASAISLAANNMMFLRGDQTVFGKVGRGGPWTQETNPGAAKAIAVGADGLNEVLIVNGEIDTRPGFGFGGWTAETSPSSATAIAASQ